MTARRWKICRCWCRGGCLRERSRSSCGPSGSAASFASLGYVRDDDGRLDASRGHARVVAAGAGCPLCGPHCHVRVRLWRGRGCDCRGPGCPRRSARVLGGIEVALGPAVDRCLRRGRSLPARRARGLAGDNPLGRGTHVPDPPDARHRCGRGLEGPPDADASRWLLCGSGDGAVDGVPRVLGRRGRRDGALRAPDVGLGGPHPVRRDRDRMGPDETRPESDPRHHLVGGTHRLVVVGLGDWPGALGC